MARSSRRALEAIENREYLIGGGGRRQEGGLREIDESVDMVFNLGVDPRTRTRWCAGRWCCPRAWKKPAVSW